MQNVLNAWRHKSLRFSADGVRCTSAIPAYTLLLLERPVVEESVDCKTYDIDVRDVAASLAQPSRGCWCPVKGSDVEEMAINSTLSKKSNLLPDIRVRFLHYFSLTETDPNSELFVSTFPEDSTVAVVSLKDIGVGEDVCFMGVTASESTEKITEDIVNVSIDFTKSVRQLQRWVSVDMVPQIEEAAECVKDKRTCFIDAVRKALQSEELSEAYKAALQHYAEKVCPGLPDVIEQLYLPRPPTVSALDCEHAVQVIEIRKQCGVRDLQKTLKDHLEQLKSFTPSDTGIPTH